MFLLIVQVLKLLYPANPSVQHLSALYFFYFNRDGYIAIRSCDTWCRDATQFAENKKGPAQVLHKPLSLLHFVL